MKINVNEIFYSIQGETTRAGFPSVFIRLSGCNLSCRYCDTVYARSGGEEMGIDRIIEKVRIFKYHDHITVTGGEPLMQENALLLLSRLLHEGFSVQVETNGSMNLAGVPAGIRKIADVKTPSSGEEGSFLIENLKYIGAIDEIKFVISDMADYEFAKKFMAEHLRETRAVINFSPAHGDMPWKDLANCILADGLKVRLNLQLHKIIDIR